MCPLTTFRKQMMTLLQTKISQSVICTRVLWTRLKSVDSFELLAPYHSKLNLKGAFKNRKVNFFLHFRLFWLD